jgi:uncharacterized protein YqjF (DUF2071 family)
MSFLKAEWRKLILMNYQVPPSLLQPLVPNHTELDLWNGNCYISLVGFLFKETTVKGIKVPFHINFEEVNLRFYVKHTSNEETKRGVVFIKEIVPKPIIKFIANQFFNENYVSTKMKHQLVEDKNELIVGYEWKNKGESQSFKVKAENSLRQCDKNSLDEFITEHYWGYNQKNDTTLAYEVKHPKWDLYKVLEHEIRIDFSATYGKNYGFLSNKTPDSIILAEGSEISVEHQSKVRLA